MNNLELSNDTIKLRREYHKNWRNKEENKTRLKEYRRNYWERKVLEEKLKNKASGRSRHDE